MADEKIKLDVEVDVGKAIQEAGSLKTAIRDAEKEFVKLQNTSGTTAKQLDDQRKKIDALRDASDKAKFSAGSFADRIAALPGPLGKLGGGLKSVGDSFATFGNTLTISLGIVGLLVTAFFAIKNALGKTEEGTKGLAAATTAFNKVLAPLLAIFEKLGLILLPILTKGLEAVGKVITKLAGFFGVSTAKIEETTASLEKNNEAANQLAEAEKKREEERKKQQEEAKKRFEERLKRIETQDKLDEALLNKEKARELSRAQTEDERFQVEKKYAKLSYEARLKDINDKMALYKKDSVEYKALQTEKTNLEAEYINQLTAFTDKEQKANAEKFKAFIEGLKKEQEARKQFAEKVGQIQNAAISDEVQKALDARKRKYEKDLSDLEADKQFIKKSEEEKQQLRNQLKQAFDNDTAKITKDAELKKIDEELKMLAMRNESLLAGTRAYFDGRRELIDLQEKKELAQLDLTEAQKTAIIEKYAKLRKDINRDELASFGQTISATIDAIANLGNAIASSMDEEAKTSKKAFETRKKLQIATAAMSAASGIIQILTQPSTLPSPADWIVKGINAAALAVTTAVNIAKIKKTQFDSGEGASASAGRTSAAQIQAPQIPSIMAPQIQGLTGGMNPSAQIAETIGRAQQPVRAYVVSGEISSQQALDRRTNRAATFVGG